MSVTLSAPGATPGDRHVLSWRKHVLSWDKDHRSNPEVLFKALTLLVNLLYIFIYAYVALP